MRGIRSALVIALVIALAAPALAWSQAAPKPSETELKATLEIMESNVSRISQSLESERWSANISLWRMRLGRMGSLQKADLGWMRASLDSIHTIVAQIRNPDERQRWEANRDLWQATLDHAGTPSGADASAMRATFTEMNANVAKITAPGESERWMANCDLWKAVLGVK